VISALLLDLDDTLYEYGPCEIAARDALAARFAALFALGREAFESAFSDARRAVKARCHTPSAHSRLLYTSEMVHSLAAGGVPRIGECRGLEEAYWSAYLAAMTPRAHALSLITSFRARGGKVAIVTDLTLDIQIRKLERLGLLPHLDALVASEEVGTDKPARAPFALAAERLGVPLEACAMVGDNLDKDGRGAELLGIPFYHARTDATGIGLTLEHITADVFRRNSWTA